VSKTLAPLPDLDCACASIRRASRLVTQLYSHEMGPQIEPGQFALLSALSGHPGIGQGPLGRALGLDKTTLSRNLRVLEKNGWIERSTRAADRREHGYHLTPAGTKILTGTKIAWTQAQTKLRNALHPGEWETMLRMFGRIAEAALAAEEL
jgi:DNA-binding MarR family transcriptional regulator